MNAGSPGQSPPTALERRERRPTATILFLVALFMLPMGTCGGIGTWKAIHLGETPEDTVFEAATGLVIAGFLALVLLAVVIVILRGRRKPLYFVERVVPLRQELDPARLRMMLGPGFREAQITPTSLVYLTGVTASRAQAVGAFSPDAYPQRVEIWRDQGGGGYRELHVRVRVSEIFAQPAGPIPQIMPTLMIALETTLQRVIAALGS